MSEPAENAPEHDAPDCAERLHSHEQELWRSLTRGIAHRLGSSFTALLSHADTAEKAEEAAQRAESVTGLQRVSRAASETAAALFDLADLASADRRASLRDDLAAMVRVLRGASSPKIEIESRLEAPAADRTALEPHVRLVLLAAGHRIASSLLPGDALVLEAHLDEAGGLHLSAGGPNAQNARVDLGALTRLASELHGVAGVSASDAPQLSFQITLEAAALSPDPAAP